MKIAIFTDTFFPHQVNGVAKAAFRQAEILRKRGHDVRVWGAHSVPSMPFWGYKGEKVVLPLGRAYREAKAWKPDIIHAHTPFVIGWEAVALSKKTGAPLVGTNHTFFDHYLKHVKADSASLKRASWKYFIWFYNFSKMVLSPSKALLDEMRENGLRAPAQYFPNSIDTEGFFPPDEKRKVELKEKLGLTGKTLIYMGRLSYEKSIDKALEAFAAAKLEDAKFLIVGDGPERKKLEKLSKSLSISEKTRFTGMLHGADLLEALQASDLFISASKSENMPISMLEAMAAGLPIVGVDALGVPEIVEDGVSGYIAPPDAVEAMADKIKKILSDDSLREAMSKAARAKSLQYAEEAQAKMLEEIYNQLI